MTRKMRIVVKVETFMRFSALYNKEVESLRFVEVYCSAYKSDCLNWIKRQPIQGIYKIYVEEG